MSEAPTKRFWVIFMFILRSNSLGRSCVEIEDEFDMTRDRVMASLRRLERMGFIFKKKAARRANGITWHTDPLVCIKE
jgi:DNA-binding MarR family transcriptional regulator